MFDRLILFVTASPLRRFRNSQNTKRVEPVTIRTGIFPPRQERHPLFDAGSHLQGAGLPAGRYSGIPAARQIPLRRVTSGGQFVKTYESKDELKAEIQKSLDRYLCSWRN